MCRFLLCHLAGGCALTEDLPSSSTSAGVKFRAVGTSQKAISRTVPTAGLYTMPGTDCTEARTLPSGEKAKIPAPMPGEIFSKPRCFLVATSQRWILSTLLLQAMNLPLGEN